MLTHADDSATKGGAQHHHTHAQTPTQPHIADAAQAPLQVEATALQSEAAACCGGSKSGQSSAKKKKAAKGNGKEVVCVSDPNTQISDGADASSA